MLNRKQILELLKALNAELAKEPVRGEIGLCGGAVMCLVYQTREATKDVDALFEPTEKIRKAAARIAVQFNLPDDWLNDAAKGYFASDPPKQMVLELSHLRVWAPKPEYMLAMKCISARYDTHDADDVKFLIEYLGLKKPEEVFNLVSQYYPKTQIPAKTQFFVEELFEI